MPVENQSWTDRASPYPRGGGYQSVHRALQWIVPPRKHFQTRCESRSRRCLGFLGSELFVSSAPKPISSSLREVSLTTRYERRTRSTKRRARSLFRVVRYPAWSSQGLTKVRRWFCGQYRRTASSTLLGTYPIKTPIYKKFRLVHYLVAPYLRASFYPDSSQYMAWSIRNSFFLFLPTFVFALPHGNRSPDQCTDLD